MEVSLNVCELCSKSFAAGKSLRRHLRRVHLLLPSVEGMLPCPLTCGESLRYYKGLRNHLTVTHNMHIEKEDHYFQSILDFEQWKQHEEAVSSALYVQNSAARKVKQGKKFYYHCHRSGFFKSTSTGKRPGRSLGSTKMGSACPSTMCVTEYDEDGYIHVEFWKTHVGHCKEVGYTTISASERGVLAGKNSEGTYKKIINNFSVEYHTDEAASVCILVDTLAVVGGVNNPVLYYKPQNEADEDNELRLEDTMLVLMTKFQKQMLQTYGCHKLCIGVVSGKIRYNYHLVSVSAIDEYDSGCPVAYCITNRIDALAMRKFFCILLSCFGSMYCRVLMTDITPEIHSAWCDIMGIPDFHLLSTWDVEKNWRINLHRSLMPKVLKTMIYRSLRQLVTVEDRYEFKQMLQNFINDKTSDQTVASFMDYFVKIFATKPESWAHCHWAAAGVNTNMYLESLHNALHYCCVQGKRNKRLDYCIQTILKLSRDIVLNRLIEMSNAETLVETISETHELACYLPTDHITLLDDGTYKVKSTDDNAVVYRVSKESALNCNCNRMCDECNICLHTYSCTCIDFLINFSICEHIHACVQYGKDQSVIVENPSVSTPTSNLPDVVNTNTANGMQCLTQLTRQLMDITHSHTELTDDACQAAIYHVKQAINALQDNKVASNTSNSVQNVKDLPKSAIYIVHL